MHFRLSLVTVLSILSWSFSCAAFSFSAGTPTQCDELSITWTGGTAPYLLLLTPVFGTPRNISIPDSAYSGGKGTYKTQIPFPSGQKLVMVMSDASGFGAGGATDVLTVGSSLGGSCNMTDPGVAFLYELNTALQQCRTYTFSAYDGAVQPVTIMGIIPNGDTFVMNPPSGPTEYDWTADVYNGTSIIFAMADSQGRQGGSSDVKTVGTSTDQSCIDDSSPSSTAAPSTSPTASTTTTVTSAAASETTSSGSGTPIGAIAGTVLGGLVFLAAVITLALFFLRRKRDREHRYDDGTDLGRHSRRFQSDIDLVDGYDTRSHGNTPSGSAFPFFTRGTDYASSSPGSEVADYHSRGMPDSPPNPFASPRDHDQTPTSVDPFTAHHHSQPSSSQTMSSAQRKAAMAGNSYTPSRFILHTDIDDVPLPPPDEDGVVELPPQYSERKAPQTIPSSSSLSRTTDDTPLYPASSQLSPSQSHHSHS